MNVDVHEPLGATVTGVSLPDLDTATVDELGALLAERGVVVLPGQRIGDAEFVEFLRSFGDLVFTTGETPVDGFPDLNVVTNVGRSTPPRSTFHTDTSYVRDPPAYTALRAVEVPSRGGATLFTDQYRAYETLTDGMRATLSGRTITHVVTGLDLDGEAETEAEHLALRPHPVTGRIALFLSTPQRCVSVSGMGEARSRDTIDDLFSHSTDDRNVFRHEWSTGDVVMWDNACVLHRADHSAVQGDRVMHRGMVARHRL